MPDGLEVLLGLVAEGKITAEEAAPIVEALQAKASGDGREAAGQTWPPRWFEGDPRSRRSYAGEALANRRVTVLVAENGRQVVNLSLPLAAAGFAIDQVPGLSSDHRSRIAEAIRKGVTGPILEVSDHGDEVRIVIE